LRASDADLRYPSTSAAEAVKRAGWMVNGPVFLLMFGSPVLVGSIAITLGFKPWAVIWAAIAAAPIGWFAAWTSWSILTPHWRLWAYRRVSDLDELKVLAVKAQVLWPAGHKLERTEIVSPYIRQEVLRLEAEFARRREAEA